jgi:hypothetical protein
MKNKPDPYDFIKALSRDAIITVSELVEACGIDDITAKRSLSSAFASRILKPMQRRSHTNEPWQFHILAITRLRENQMAFDIAFQRT